MAGTVNFTAKATYAHIATDPLRNFRFHVTFNNSGSPLHGQGTTMGFMSVSGLSVTTEVIPYRQGGYNTTTQKMPGQTDFSPITLSKGLIVGDKQMMDWMKKIFRVVNGSPDATEAKAAYLEFRSHVDILVLDHPHTGNLNVPVKAAFRVYNAWPTSVSFSDLDAGANAIVVQQMTLAHEGFDFAVANHGVGTSVDRNKAFSAP